nr:PREDICTED: serine/threonine-protein kinase VRK1-like [Bemisia tabaci]
MAPRRSTFALESPPKKKGASNDSEVEEFLQEGEVLTDITKNKWKLGKSIGAGGFGKIYLASQNLYGPVDSNAKYVIKVEPHKNGPLFVEMNFYLRVAKLDMIDNWVARHELKNLGIPYYVGCGSHTSNGKRYRFLIMPRFGTNLHNVFCKTGQCFTPKTSFTLASYIIDILEYIHSYGYVHSDIKGSNLVIGRDNQAPIYLLDFGLSAKYLDSHGNHKPYLSDARIAHNGTLEFTSRDAHTGAHSRRGDLEILAYVLIKWLCGKLPWEDKLSDPEEVASMKNSAMANIPRFLSLCFEDSKPPSALVEYVKYVVSMSFDAKPNYKYCKRIFKKGVQDVGSVFDGKLSFEFNNARGVKRKKCQMQGNSEAENIPVKKKKKLIRPDLKPLTARQLLNSQNINRITRTVKNKLARTRHRKAQLGDHEDFDWAKIIASNPEKKTSHTPPKKTRLSSISLSSTVPDPSAKVQPPASVLIKRIEESPEFQNPTPAMRFQIDRMKQRLYEIPHQCAPNKRTKNESNHHNGTAEAGKSSSGYVNGVNGKLKSSLERNCSLRSKKIKSSNVPAKKDKDTPTAPITTKRKLSFDSRTHSSRNRKRLRSSNVSLV